MRRMQFLLSGVLAVSASVTAAQDVVPANWREINVQFPFNGRGTQYHCHRVERKVLELLELVGANPNTTVRASGCQFERPSRNIVFTIRTAVPVLAPPRPVEKTQMEALVAKQWGPQPFQATWKQFNLARERNANLRPGDCELVRALVTQLFSQMTINIESSTDLCSPDVLSQRMKDFNVTALVPVK
jgi:hypothetical protein